MSNKTQLQTNNTNLDALIARVNAAKDTAASLPEAGSGGGSVETCTVDVTFMRSGMITGQVQCFPEELIEGMSGRNSWSSTITLMKNSMLFVSHSLSVTDQSITTTGNVQYHLFADSGMATYYVFYVQDNGTIEITI